MDSRGRDYYIKAAAAAAAEAADAFSDDEELAAELDHPKAASQKKPEAAQGADLSDLACPECGKVFMSDKAMYGHLRSHPARAKKGAKVATAAADDDEDFVVRVKKQRKAVVVAAPRRKELQLDEPHPGKSPVTGKRGRPATSSSTDSTPAPAPPAPGPLSTVLITPEEEAAMTLLDIASGRRLEKPAASHVADELPSPAKLPRMPTVEQDDDDDDHVAAAGDNDEGQKTWEAEKPTPPPVEHVFGIATKKLAPAPVATGKVVVLQEHVAAVITGAYQPRMPAPEPKTPVKPWPVTDQAVQEQTPPAPPPPAAPTVTRRIPSPASKKTYACSTCRKAFPSHQALGGHMASHKRVQKQQDVVAALVAEAQAPAAHNHLAHHYQRHHDAVAVVDVAPVVASGVAEDTTAAAVATRTQHKCEQCSMIFPTGQALGGHKRKHYIEGKELQEAIASAMPAPPPIAGDTPENAEQPPVASFMPAPPTATHNFMPAQPIEYNFMAAPPTDNTAPVPPIAGAAPDQQPGRSLFDLNEMPKEEGGTNNPSC